LHLGNARSFLITWARARQLGGELLLRIEDLHLERTKAGALEQIFDDLKWLGLDWDIGPQSCVKAQNDPIFLQSNRRDFYRKGLDQLRDSGKIYPCSCTRKDLLNFQSAPHPGEELHYPNHCRDRNTADVIQEAKLKGKPLSWRFKVHHLETSFIDALMGISTTNVNDWSGDFIVARGKDDVGYQLAVVLDDVDQGVTEVVRGDDLLLSTHRQLQVLEALGKNAPNHLHLPLLLGEDGIRLAKRHGDWKISTLRALGHTPERVLGLISWTLGWSDYQSSISAADFLDAFNLKNMTPTAFSIPTDVSFDMGVAKQG
jgi:glutamyl-tRNA synthetase